MDYPAVVLGAGPAGARVAQRLAAGGVRVLLLEQSDGERDKLCGGLLNRRGQAALGCDLPEQVRRAPYAPPLEYHDLDNRRRLRYDPGYLNLHRGRFDAWLRECAVEAGVELRYGVSVQGLQPTAQGVAVNTTDGTLTARCVIDATGWRSLSRKLLAPETHRAAPRLGALQGRIRADLPEDAMWAVYLSAVTPFYGWLIPQGGGEFLLGYGLPVPAASRRRPLMGDETSPVPIPAVPAAPVPPPAWHVLQPYLDYIAALGYHCAPAQPKPRGCPLTCIRGLGDLWWGAGNVFAIGEAAGLTSPSSGGGIHFALAHGNALAQALLEAGLASTAPGTLDYHMVTARTQQLLAPELKHLRFSCLKAWTAARPRLRGLAAHLLPLALGTKVECIPGSASF